MIYELAKQDERVVFIGSDLSPGLLDEMKAEFPDRYYMEGVYEANLIGMAAGLAMEGYIPYVNTIATFITRRCYEQIAIDLCMHNLPVRLIGNGGGVVYAPLGPTHLAIEDISIMRTLPNMTVTAVSDANEMTRLMQATLDWPQPIYIRLGKGGDEIVSCENKNFAIGKAINMHQTLGERNIRVLIVSTGIMTQRALKVAKMLESSTVGITVLHCHTIKPLDIETLVYHAAKTNFVITMEENVLIGGLGSAVSDCLIEALGNRIPYIKRFALPDQFPHKYGSQEMLLDYYGLNVNKLSADITDLISTHFTSQREIANEAMTHIEKFFTTKGAKNEEII